MENIVADADSGCGPRRPYFAATHKDPENLFL